MCLNKRSTAKAPLCYHFLLLIRVNGTTFQVDCQLQDDFSVSSLANELHGCSATAEEHDLCSHGRLLWVR